MYHYITYFEIAAFAASLVAFPVIRKNRYLRVFPVLLATVVSVEVYHGFFNSGRPINAEIYNMQVPLQHLLYLYILMQAVEAKKYKNLFILFAALLILFTAITLIFFTPEERFNALAYCLGLIFIVAGILINFYEMLQRPSGLNFLRNPYFYILFAYLLFIVGTLPYFAMGNWLYYVTGERESRLVLQNVMSFFNYILYSTYTIAFIWIAKRGY